mmetsp:Transcript_92404/g.177406  ORF Transcript_92404/g.177406 Transcript_92404/m.177406 type:complete len:221 (+) Transcript_92404:1856-2518(+)
MTMMTTIGSMICTGQRVSRPDIAADRLLERHWAAASSGAVAKLSVQMWSGLGRHSWRLELMRAGLRSTCLVGASSILGRWLAPQWILLLAHAVPDAVMVHLARFRWYVRSWLAVVQWWVCACAEALWKRCAMRCRPFVSRPKQREQRQRQTQPTPEPMTSQPCRVRRSLTRSHFITCRPSVSTSRPALRRRLAALLFGTAGLELTKLSRLQASSTAALAA